MKYDISHLSPFSRAAVNAVESAGVPFPSGTLAGEFLGSAIATVFKELVLDAYHSPQKVSDPEMESLMKRLENLETLAEQQAMLIQFLIAHNCTPTRESLEKMLVHLPNNRPF